MSRPGVFLDRDGVINENRADYVKSWEEFRFLPGALASLRRLAATDCPIVVVSNQSAIGRGLVTRREVDEINRRMAKVVAEEGGRVDLVLYCPHVPWEGCDCRKPRPGMLLRAADLLGLSLPDSFLVGDAASDVFAAQAAGCRSILVKTGLGSSALQTLAACQVTNFESADDLEGAVDLIAAGRVFQLRNEGSA